MFEVINNRKVLLAVRSLGVPLALTPAGLLLGIPHAAQTQTQADVAAFTPFFTIFISVSILDFIIGLDKANVSPKREPGFTKNLFFRLIPLLVLPIQVAVVIWGAWVVTHFELFSTLGKIGWMLSVGLITGFSGITAAHELIHRDTAMERNAGGILLSTVCYGGFKVEHVLGHHVNVSTPNDASSADYNQSLYHFLLRAYFHNVKNAWSLQKARMKRAGKSFYALENELFWWTGISIGFAVLLFSLWGWLALVYFLVQSFMAITLLEMVNYIEHYGLRRRKLENGKYESVKPHHSWNSSHFLTNLYLFQLQRHSDHHANASRRYQILRHMDDVPQLPLGYSGMILLALIPPLWMKIMNPKVDQWRNRPLETEAA